MKQTTKSIIKRRTRPLVGTWSFSAVSVSRRVLRALSVFDQKINAFHNDRDISCQRSKIPMPVRVEPKSASKDEHH